MNHLIKKDRDRVVHSVGKVIEQLYKLESAKLLAVLTRLFGPQHFSMAEDVLQEAFSQAMIHWEEQGVPQNPSAWIMRCAKHQAIDVIRKNKTRLNFAEDLSHFLASEWSIQSTVEQQFSESKIKDDQLRMIFACCDIDIKAENRIPFILRTLCGLSVEAIARALLQTTTVIKKRLLRTRKLLQKQQFRFPEPEQLETLREKVHMVLYLLFNEGFHSGGVHPINPMFCQEAIGLAKLLLDDPRLVNQETLGLLALMHFHMGRLNSRTTEQGMNIPIDQQDRQLWDRILFAQAQQFIEDAKKNSNAGAGRFYLESLIAKEHCLAASFIATNWVAIVNLYHHLIVITGSPIAKLNQAIAIAYAGNIERGITLVEALQTEPVFNKSHLPMAVLAHMNAMLGKAELAQLQVEKSLSLGGTEHEQQLLKQQVQRLLNG